MTISYANTLRTARMNQVTAAVDAGAGPGLLRIYDAPKPSPGGALTTQILLTELTFSDPSFPAAVSGLLTASGITPDASANSSGTAAWFRVVDSTGVYCMDGTVGTSGADLNLTTVAIVATQPVSVTSFAITEGNP